MAKLKYLQNISEQSEDFTGDFDLTVKQNGKQATWVVDGSGAQVVLEGTGLAASEEQPDWIGAGKITGVTLINGDEKQVVDISGLNIKATKLTAVYESEGVAGLLNLVTSGDDTVVGTKKADYLISGAGDDELTGKGGSDTFSFHALVFEEAGKKSSEADVITDFDVKGDDRDYLELDQDYSVKGVHKQHDTLLTFDDGSTLLLEGVTKKQFTAYMDSLDV